MRKGLELSDRRDRRGAAERFGRAVAVYAGLLPCDGLRCDREELRTLMDGRNKTYRDYANSMTFIELGTRVLRAVGVQKAVLR